MNETDDRLAGDPVWELFPQAAPGPARAGLGPFPYGQWLVVACLIVLGLLRYPPLAVLTLCLAVSARDFMTGWKVARSIADEAGGKVCACFAYAWGAWKIGAAGFACFVATLFLFTRTEEYREPPSTFVPSALVFLGGFTAAAALAAWGLLAAYHSGMRIWIGEGVNRARTLFLGMLIVGFVFVGILPFCVWLAVLHPIASSKTDFIPLSLMMFCGLVVGPIVILLLLDRIHRRLIAERPGKFGPKVPTIGKWGA